MVLKTNFAFVAGYELHYRDIKPKIIAEQFAKMILCENFLEEECGSCKSCIEFASNNNPNYIYIFLKTFSN